MVSRRSMREMRTCIELELLQTFERHALESLLWGTTCLNRRSLRFIAVRQ